MKSEFCGESDPRGKEASSPLLQRMAILKHFGRAIRGPKAQCIPRVCKGKLTCLSKIAISAANSTVACDVLLMLESKYNRRSLYIAPLFHKCQSMLRGRCFRPRNLI